jgi:hypothetical protein
MNINILPDDIDKLVKESIIKSALGQDIAGAIHNAINEALKSYDSPIKKYTNKIIGEIIQEYLSKEENRKPVYDSIIKHLTPEAVNKIMDHGIKKLLDEIERYR